MQPLRRLRSLPDSLIYLSQMVYCPQHYCLKVATNSRNCDRFISSVARKYANAPSTITAINIGIGSNDNVAMPRRATSTAPYIAALAAADGQTALKYVAVPRRFRHDATQPARTVTGRADGHGDSNGCGTLY